MGVEGIPAAGAPKGSSARAVKKRRTGLTGASLMSIM